MSNQHTHTIKTLHPEAFRMVEEHLSRRAGIGQGVFKRAQVSTFQQPKIRNNQKLWVFNGEKPWNLMNSWLPMSWCNGGLTNVIFTIPAAQFLHKKGIKTSKRVSHFVYNHIIYP